MLNIIKKLCKSFYDRHEYGQGRSAKTCRPQYYVLGMQTKTSFLRILILILEFREFLRMRAASGFENEVEGNDFENSRGFSNNSQKLAITHFAVPG